MRIVIAEDSVLLRAGLTKLLTDGGYLLLTTPNVAHWLGRVRFLLQWLQLRLDGTQ